MEGIKFAVYSFLSGDRYLGGAATDCRELLRDGTAMFRTRLVPFWWQYIQRPPNASSRKGIGWTILVSHSRTPIFSHLTANIPETVSRSVTRQLRLNIS